MIDIKKQVLAAEERIRPYIRRTPLEYSHFLSRLGDSDVYLKLENLQHTGSFKTRGAMSRLLTLDRDEKKNGIITASTGNHGLATALSMNRFNIKGTIYLPENASPQKIEMLKNYNADLKFFGKDSEETEIKAREESKKTGKIYVSPYNDPAVIGGQGTVGVEILEQLNSVDCIFASVGGGGLLSGIAGYIKDYNKQIQIIGCQPENSAVMYDSISEGKIINKGSRPTLSDGTAGGIEPEAITFEPCRKYVDEWVLVTEDEITQSMKIIFEQHRLVIEGAAGVAVAGYLKLRDKLRNKKVAIIICGGNIDIKKFKRLVF